jgi:hypothetical protein
VALILGNYHKWLWAQADENPAVQMSQMQPVKMNWKGNRCEFFRLTEGRPRGVHGGMHGCFCDAFVSMGSSKRTGEFLSKIIAGTFSAP